MSEGNLASEAFDLASSTIQSRMNRVLELVEEAASSGCFSLEVPLDESFGTAGFWWDGENQNTVGDFLCARGLHVKFRNPRKSGSVYPSLFVDWFDEDHVAQLVNELHEKSK